MSDLKTDITNSADILKEVWNTSTAALNKSDLILPAECYKQWKDLSDFHKTLRATVHLFPARDKAWELFVNVSGSESVNDLNPNTIKYNGLETDFAIARHLTLISYITVTWSIYDRLSNVCGRIAGVPSLAMNVKQNPKALGDFIDQTKYLGFSFHKLLKSGYGKPLRTMYMIRNTLVHDGCESSGIPLFENDHPGCCTLHEEHIKIIDEKIRDRSPEGCCLVESDDLWATKDLKRILKAYQDEVDNMFSSFVKWSTYSLSLQFELFAQRDKEKLGREDITETPA